MGAMTPDESPDAAAEEGAPSATRKDLQLGRRLFHLANGVSVATAYALLFTHQQVVHLFGTIACLVYVGDRIRIAYPEVVARNAPWVNRLFVRAEERVRESAMIPFAIAVLLTILTLPKGAALVGIYALAIADPLAAVVGIRFGSWRVAPNRTLEGSLVFFAATCLIAAVVLGWNTGVPPLTIAGAAAMVAAVGAICEALPLRLDDNLTIPLIVGFATWGVATVLGLPLG
jgi:dolichol kinase